MLKTALEEATRRVPGCRAAALVGRDGIVVEHWSSGAGPAVEALAGELTPLLRAVESLATQTDAGELREILVRLASWSCLVKPMTEEIFLVIVADSDTVPGRLRFEALRASSRFEAELR